VGAVCAKAPAAQMEKAIEQASSRRMADPLT
jgi:hypothetical protein